MEIARMEPEWFLRLRKKHCSLLFDPWVLEPQPICTEEKETSPSRWAAQREAEVASWQPNLQKQILDNI